MNNPGSLIPPHGGYRNLVSFKVAQLAFDVTVRFCERYVSWQSRTRDQMEQAARSGVQNIAESSKASGTSKRSELKLTNVARASLEELRLDYLDFLRQHGLEEWSADDPRREELVKRRCGSAGEVAEWVREVRAREVRPPTYAEVAANAALVLIGVACALLDRQIAALARAFEEKGGFTERLYRVRREQRTRQGGRRPGPGPG